MRTKEIIKRAIKQALRNNPNLRNYDNPYSYICEEIAQSGNILKDMFTDKANENSIQWAERIESKIDTVWNEKF